MEENNYVFRVDGINKENQDNAMFTIGAKRRFVSLYSCGKVLLNAPIFT